jgi:rod shape-determining protein MreC
MSNTTRIFIVVFLSIVFMFVDHRGQKLEGVRSIVGTFVTPLLLLAEVPHAFFDWSSSVLVSRAQLRQQNVYLSAQLKTLKAQLQKLIALETENSRLRNLLGTQNESLEKRLLAEIIHIDQDPFNLEFTINKGNNHGIYIGQTVIDAQGIVGQIISVSEFTSRVIMISDVTHAIPTQVLRNNIRAIARGSGQMNQLIIQNITDTTDIKKGDQLISSGLGQKFPKGYPVATVTQVIHEPGKNYAIITAQPTAQLERLSSVLLVWKMAQPALSPPSK